LLAVLALIFALQHVLSEEDPGFGRDGDTKKEDLPCLPKNECYFIVVTWARVICPICLPKALGLPDMYVSRALGIYIRQITRAHVTNIM